VMMYAQDWEETLPKDVTASTDLPADDPCSLWNPKSRIEAKLRTYLKDTGVLACASATTPPVTWDSTRGVCHWGDWGYPEFMCFRGDSIRGKALSYGWNQLVFYLRVPTFGGGCSAP